jgi:hypothetical protein
MRMARTIRTVTKTISDDKPYNYYQGISTDEWRRLIVKIYREHPSPLDFSLYDGKRYENEWGCLN